MDKTNTDLSRFSKSRQRLILDAVGQGFEARFVDERVILSDSKLTLTVPLRGWCVAGDSPRAIALEVAREYLGL